MSSRPDVELVLDLRHGESIVVLSNPESTYDYPPTWFRCQRREDFPHVASDIIVVVDRIDITRRTMADIGRLRPRLVAFAPNGVEQEKSMRRMITSTYPWSEVWTVASSFGKLLVTKDIQGEPYDRDQVGVA